MKTFAVLLLASAGTLLVGSGCQSAITPLSTASVRARRSEGPAPQTMSFLAPQALQLLGGAPEPQRSVHGPVRDPARQAINNLGSLGLSSEDLTRARRSLEGFVRPENRRLDSLISDQQARERQRLKEAGL